jgi:hypothetical protein
MRIAQRIFSGIAPRLDPRRLGETNAQTATNCDLRNGTLRALRGTSAVWTPPKTGPIRTIYRFGQTITDESLYWFHWADDVDVVRGQIAGDTDERTYFAGDSAWGHPRVTKASIALTADIAGAGNLLQYPTNFENAAWEKVNITITQNATTAPDGTATADKIESTTTTGTTFSQTRVATSTEHVACVYAKAGNKPEDYYILRNDTSATNLVVGTVTWATASISGTGATMVDVGNGWYRITLTATAGITVGNTLRVFVGLTGYAVTTGYYCYGWGATLVAGTTPLDWLVVMLGYPMQSYRLGVPAPASAPTSGGVSGVGTGVVETRSYIYTYVTGDGEEGAPSLAVLINAQEGQTVTLNGLVTPPSGYNITSKRIYRTVSTASTPIDFQFIVQIAAATTTYADAKLTEELAEVIPSLEWAMPPATLRGLVNLPNGMMAGFTGNDVYFCEPYRPFAWPTKYMQAVDAPVVGLGAFAETLVVLTKAMPYVMYGSDPGTVVSRQSELAEACVAKRSIVNMAGSVIYASPNGLVMVGPSGGSVITAGIIDKEFWQSLNPTSIEAYHYDGRYIGFYDNGTHGGFQFDPGDGNQPFSMLDAYAIAGYNDVVRDSLYLNVAGVIRQWDEGGSPYSYTWRSRVHELPHPDNFGWCQVVAATYPVTIYIYADGVLKHTQVVADTSPFRLPSGFMARDWEFEVYGTYKVTAIYLAQGIDELRVE